MRQLILRWTKKSFDATELQREWAPETSHIEGPDSHELKRGQHGFLETAWWRLAWEASCDEVSCRFGDVEKTCSAVSFSMPLLYRRIFSDGREHDEFLKAIENFKTKIDDSEK